MAKSCGMPDYFIFNKDASKCRTGEEMNYSGVELKGHGKSTG